MSSSEERVVRAVKQIESHPEFNKWLTEEKATDGDLILINNSFVFRDVQTDKSSRYLAAEVGTGGCFLKMPPSVATLSSRQNMDFRRLAKVQARPVLEPLGNAMAQETRTLGNLIFGLIGNVTDDRQADITLHKGSIKRIVWNPAAPGLLTLNDDTVEIKSVEDEDRLWTAYLAAAAGSGLSVSPDTQVEFAEALDRLLGLGSASLRLPDGKTRSKPGILDTILKALRDHLSEYGSALESYSRARGDQARRTHFNEILRVAYAFSQEASTLLRLIVSICDLKPLVLWATIDKHYELSEALKSLPWTRSRRKPSLGAYISLVGDARNRAFHNVFPFNKALYFELPEGTLKGAELRIFSEFGSRTHGNELTYHDKAVAEVMLGFTRARQRPTPDAFWQKNHSVMKCMVDLFTETNDLLKNLYADRLKPTKPGKPKKVRV